jgi:phytoene synthase
MNLHDADEYCRQKAAPPGGSFYYSILFYPEHLRRDLRALHALGIELEEIITECSDPGVMRIKFAWWQDEIMRLYQHAARHPVSRALANVITRHDIQQHQLQEIISNVEQLTAMTQPPSMQEVLMMFGKGPGLVWRLSAKICGHQKPETMTLAGEMGGLFSCFHILQQPARSGTGPAAQCTPQERSLLIQDIQKMLTHYCAVFPAADRYRQLHILIMGHIIAGTCEKIQRNGKLQALTPLKKLWMAWRLQRRYRSS